MTFLRLSLSGAVFVLAIAVFRMVTLRRLPKGTFVALWWMAAVRLLVPLKLASRFSVYTLWDSLRPKAPVSAAPISPAAPAAIPVQLLPNQPVTPVQPPADSFPIWTALWLTVGCLLAVWFLVRYVRWCRRFRESLPVNDPCLDTWFQFRRKVQIRISDQIAAPLTYGFFRPVVLLPKSLDFTDEAVLACVLAHEGAHIRRLDGLLKLALAAVLCLHWFNPAVWLLYVLANRDMELRCDEAAVLALGADSRERYALALIQLAEKQSVPLCGFAHRNGMEERIRAIMSIRKKSLLACVIALALVLGITTAFATSAKPREAEDSENIIDRELLAASSAESAAQWEETLAPYEPFGLTWTFDDPDLDGNGLSMTWEGREVCGIYDQTKGIWITEHTGNSTFGPGAVELCTVYEDGKLTGLRLAAEEEQKAFARDRALSSDSLKLETLAESVRYDSGSIYFTIPEGEGRWSIFIRGRLTTEDGLGMSVHYLEEESEKAEWIPRMTYSFAVADAAYDELILDAAYGNASYCYPLTPLLPESGKRLPGLPEGKADIPAGTTLVWPVSSTQINNGFGQRALPGGRGSVDHNGVDIGGLAEGAPIYAAAAGTVKDTGFSAQDGNYVRLDHGNGLESYYAHCLSVVVKTGDAVALGQTIAAVGSTGVSTGVHLHFALSQDGVPQNPESLLQSAPEAQRQPESKPEPEAKPEPSPEPEEPAGLTAQRDQLDHGDYPQNSQGETYGNAFGHDLVGHEPDLMAAVGTNGEKGYISMEESQLKWSPTPEEILAYQNWMEENNVGGYLIPLYDSEHHVIGEFQVGGGESGRRIVSYEEYKAAKANGWPNSKGSTLTEKESEFKSIEEAREAALNGWSSDS